MYALGSLFTGIGGIDLAFQRAGFQIAFQVEIDDYCNRVLERHWPHVERFRDVRQCSAGNLPAVDVLAGGFPCQDISTAGKGAGIKEGNRSGLWFEFARLIGDLRPRIVLLENVSAITSRDGEIVLAGLTQMGYDSEWGVIPASAVAAPHRRERWFCVAHARCWGQPARLESEGGSQPLTEASFNRSVVRDQRLAHANSSRQSQPQGYVSQFRGWPEHSSEALAHASGTGLEGFGSRGSSTSPTLSEPASIHATLGDTAGEGLPQWGQREFSPAETEKRTRLVAQFERSNRWQAESIMGRAVDGLSRQLDSSRWPAAPGQQQHRWEAPRTVTQKVANRPARLKALGNAVVPQVVQPIAEAIYTLLAEQDQAGSGA